MDEPDEIVEVARLTATPGRDHELLTLLRGVIEPSRKEEDCLRYELNQEMEDPRHFTITAKFAGRAGFERHLNSRHVRHFAESANDIIEWREVRMCRELLPAGGEAETIGMPGNEETRVVVIAEFTAKPGKEQDLSTTLQAMVAQTRLEPGCLRYELNQDLNEPAVFTFVEAYADRRAFDDHVNKPYLRRLLEALPELVEKQYIGVHREVLA
jgi:quinol monooxygenase YgiN